MENETNLSWFIERRCFQFNYNFDIVFSIHFYTSSKNQTLKKHVWKSSYYSLSLSAKFANFSALSIESEKNSTKLVTISVGTRFKLTDGKISAKKNREIAELFWQSCNKYFFPEKTTIMIFGLDNFIFPPMHGTVFG